MKHLLYSVMFLLSSVAALPALPGLGTRPDFQGSLREYSSLLGLTLNEAFERFGVPAEVRSVRGDEPWQDDVVFRYEDGISIFWYRQRVWQVRFDRRFRGSFLELAVGASRSTTVDLLGEPFYAEADWILYHFAGDGFPVRLRLFFGESGLEDAYLYRGDF